MPTPKTVTFTVTGRGRFPLDMLRYDACWPVTGDDASKLDSSDYDPADRLPRRVTLRTASGQPECARWSSFGWSVDQASIRRA